MENNVSTPAATNVANTNVNPLKGKVVAQTSKQAQKLLEKAKAKSTETKGKTEKAPAKAPKAKKEPRVTIASKLDEIITKGGAWDKMIESAQAASKALGSSMKFNAGTIKAHIRFRELKNPKYLGSLKVSDKGLFSVTKKGKAA